MFLLTELAYTTLCCCCKYLRSKNSRNVVLVTVKFRFKLKIYLIAHILPFRISGVKVILTISDVDIRKRRAVLPFLVCPFTSWCLGTLSHTDGAKKKFFFHF